MEIIQHHEPVDFVALFEEQQRQQIGPDFNDFRDLLWSAKEIHSFRGLADSEDRIYEALCNALDNEEAKAIIDRALAILFCFVFSPAAPNRLNINDLDPLYDFIKQISNDININWNVVKDSSLGDVVKVYVLVGVK